nr:hypothetical protein [Tanacetum cinerariifolium]
LSASIYCRALDTITLRELIGPDGRLITEDPALEVPRVAIPKGPRLSMQDLYDRMGEYAPPGYDEEQQDDEE